MTKQTYDELEQELIELKKNQAEFSKDQQYQMLFDSMTEMIKTVDLIYNKNDEPIDFYIRDINLSFASFLGKSKEQLINKKASSIDTIENYWLTYLIVVDKTGEQIYFKNYNAELDQNFNVTVWKISQNRIGVSVVVLSESENEKNINDEQYSNRNILDNIPVDIAVFDKDHNYLYVNPHGIRDPEIRKWMIGKNDFDYCDYKNIDKTLAKDRDDYFKKSIETKEQVDWVDIYHRDGKTTHILRRLQPVFIDETLHYVVGYGIDISPQKKVQEELNQLNNSLEEKVKNRTHELEESLDREKELGQLKTSFVSMASHQFRTPLTVIRSNSDLLDLIASSYGEDESVKYEKATHRIKEEITKMTELIDDVLILGKLTSGNIHYNPQYTDLKVFCDKLVKLFNSIQKDGRILDLDLEVEEEELFIVYIDSKLLLQALSNLLSNAFKYSQGKRNPKLIVSSKPSRLSIIVKDYGFGIPKAEIQNLFQPFFRAKNATGINGTGLGLSIAKEYIEINRGTLLVTSTEGIGSSFEIMINKEEH